MIELLILCFSESVAMILIL